MNPAPTQPGTERSIALHVFLHVTVVLTGAIILVIEILGARMLTPFFGTSHFVWSAQIAVTMLALAVGYRLGGWLANRRDALDGLFRWLMVAAIYLVGTVNFRIRMATWCFHFSLPVGSTLASFILFFVPLVLLASTGPVVVRYFTSSLGDVGRQVGRLSALGTVGSVGGVLLTSYVLIPRVRDSFAMMGVAGVLASLSLVFLLRWSRSRQLSVGAAALALFVGLTHAPQALHTDQIPLWPGYREVARTNSHFGMMQVVEDREGRARYYLNEFLIQNSYDSQAKKSLSVFTEMLFGLSQAYTPEFKRALCLGMGVGIVPMRLAREGLQVEVVEINPAVLLLAQAYFGFDPSKVQLVIDDARHFLATSSGRYDTIQLDAFVGDSMPSHLMTRESFQAIKAHLVDQGTLVINTFVHFEPGRDFLAGSLHKTLKSVFRQVVIHESPGGNVFYVASDRDPLVPLREPDFNDAHSVVRNDVELTYSKRVDLHTDGGIILTDDFNPTDYRDAPNREETRRRLAASVFER